MIGVDVSNYTSTLSQGVLAAWKNQHGVGLVIAQSLNPPAGYPPGVTRQQINACAQAGMPVDIYLWLWTNSNVTLDIRAKLAVVDGLEGLIRKVWVDVEDTSQASVAARIGAARAAFAVADEWCLMHGKPTPGLYSARWYWPTYMGNTQEFGDRALWDAQYDGNPDNEAGWQPYGGWSERRIKQYAGTSTLAGQGGVDLNVLSAAEEAELTEPPPAPPVDCDWGWQSKKEVVVQTAGELLSVSDQILAEANRPAGPRRSVLRQLANPEVRARAERILS
jgi:hypothetical protein